MKEVPPPGNPNEIKVEDLQKRATNTGALRNQFLTTITGQFSAGMESLVGGLLFGSPTKKQTSPDGQVTEAPWTMGDILNKWIELGDEREKEVRELLAEDIFKAVRTQASFFYEKEHPMKERATDMAEISLLLLQKVLFSDEKISDHPYPSFEPKEAYWSAELLEVMRRTILKPSQYLLKGKGRSGINSVPGYDDQSFWEGREKLITEEMKKTPGGAEYNRLEQERQQKSISERSEHDWEQLLPEEEEYVLEYLKESVKRLSQTESEVASFAQHATYEGKRLANDDVIKELQATASKVSEIKDGLSKITNFTDVLPWIKKTFGEKATFQTLIDFLIPDKK